MNEETHEAKTPVVGTKEEHILFPAELFDEKHFGEFATHGFDIFDYKALCDLFNMTTGNERNQPRDILDQRVDIEYKAKGALQYRGIAAAPYTVLDIKIKGTGPSLEILMNSVKRTIKDMIPTFELDDIVVKDDERVIVFARHGVRTEVFNILKGLKDVENVKLSQSGLHIYNISKDTNNE